MKTTINYFGRMLCALLLCAGLVTTSCAEGPLENDEKTEQGENENTGNEYEEENENTGGNENEGGEENENEGNQETPEDKGPATMTLDKVTATTATITGHLDVAASDLSFSQVTVYYSDAETFNMNAAESVSATSFDKDQNFTIILKNLKYNTKYNYCMVAEVKSEKTYGDVLDFTTENVTFSELSVVPSRFKAEVSGSVTGLFDEDKEYIKVGILYSSESGKVENGEGKKVEATEISADGVFSVLLSDLTLETNYYYCSYVKHGGSYTYGTPKEFTTLKHPYDIQHDLNVSAAKDMSSSGSANCYIVSESGLYKFKTVKGNSNESVGSVAWASILWETFGTDTTPEMFDLISAFCYKDGYIAFKTSDTFKEGNAVIAAKDADGNILWSWHIWFTDQPQGQEYYNNAGTMMDRNLGATSATPGDVCALGLLYKWSMKEPFLGSSSSTIANNSYEYDWYFEGFSSTDNTRWTTSESSKSINDPCPAGWRVPDGGGAGVWAKALGSSYYFSYTYSSTDKGMNFSGKFGSDQTIWYPASGRRNFLHGGLDGVGNSGHYWSASPSNDDAYILIFYDDGYVNPSSDFDYANGFSVRCLQE